MESHELKVEHRVKTGKGSARKSRARGWAPGVVYGKDIEPIAISFHPAEMRAVLKSSRGRNSVFNLNVDQGRSVLAMVKDIQIDPLRRTILHSDFIQITEDRPVVVPIPFHVEGRALGVIAGGILQQLERTILVSCLPANIPVEIRADVSHLNVGESLVIKDLKLPEGTTAVAKETHAVAQVMK